MTKVNPEQVRAGANDATGPSEGHSESLQTRVLAEGRHFLVLFLYLWVLFGLFVLNERIALKQHGIDFIAHGFAVFNAFILAKVMLIAQHLNLSRWLNRRPLIYPIIHDSLLFGAIFIVFHLVEQLIVSAVRGTSSAGLQSIGGGGIGGLICVSVIFFFTLIPFFAFSNLSRALGPGRMEALLFGPGAESSRPALTN